MRVCVALEQRFERCPDGSVWTQSGFGASFWTRYLEVFDHVRILARIRDVPRLEGLWHRVDTGAISFAGVPYYVGVSQLLRQWPRVRDAVHQVICSGDAYLLRVPGVVGDLACSELRRAEYPYGVEVVGDPYDVFAPGAVRHPLRPVLRWRGVRQLTRQCRNAAAATYVTERALQARYPAGGPSTSASCLVLRADDLAVTPRTYDGAGPLRVVFVGSLEQYYKAPDVMIQAIALARQHGMDWRLTMVGAGVLRPVLERLVHTLGCDDAIHFTGHLADPAAVRGELDAADLFVLPSRTEGLPRALIEAMAAGLPCVGSDVGGIPELLPASALVPPGDVQALYHRMADLSADPARMHRMATDNLARAHDYLDDALQQRRNAFYREVQQATQAWLTRRTVSLTRTPLPCKDGPR